MTLRNSGVNGGSRRPVHCDKHIRIVLIENPLIRSVAGHIVLNKLK
jgi:hypothetical protein